jgi:TolA-binding protein
LWSGVVSWPFRIVASLPSAPQTQPAKPRRAHRAPLRAPAAVAIAQTAVPAAAPLPATATPSPEQVASPVEGAARARRNAADDAGELFHSANAARRNGDFGRAERLYSELIAAHPGSDESGLARVSLGKLRLARGDAQGAESEFRRYLAAGRGQLDEEALVGQAQSFARLGRARAEREAWQRLLIDHPSSVYAVQARARLAALERAAPPSQTEVDHSSR